MFAANNMTYQRKRAQEKKATRRAIKRAEVLILLFCIVFTIFCQARRERAEAAAQLMEQNDDVEEAVDKDDDQDNDSVGEFYDVCKNYKK